MPTHARAFLFGAAGAFALAMIGKALYAGHITGGLVFGLAGAAACAVAAIPKDFRLNIRLPFSGA